MKSRFKTFRWKRFLAALVVTFVAVMAFGKVMATDATGKQPAKAPTSTPASSGAAATPTSAAADPAAATHDNDSATRSYYHQMDSIRADTELVAVEIDNLKAHHELEQAKNGVFKSDTQAPTQAGMPMMQMPSVAPAFDSAASSESRSAVVVQTAMVDGRWVASIRLPTGSYISNTRAGQYVRGVGKILSISLNDVTVSSGGKTYSLPFANDDGSTAGAGAAPYRGGVTVAPPVGIR